MEKSIIVNDYETIIVFSIKNSKSAVEELIEKFKGLISSSAEITLFKEWGKRRLVYPINKENDGHYVLFNFKSSPDFPAELDRVLRITSGVLRSLTTRGIIKPMPPSVPKRPQRSLEEPAPAVPVATESIVEESPEDTPTEV